VPSASLVADDPTLLFVVAGMQPFKPYLLGQQAPRRGKRVADVQKCVRTLDIEEVGKTTRHATFFQMLGNWSFGDYFKEGAISYAWELLTKSEADGGFGFPADRLWATVLHGDDEAYAIWRERSACPRAGSSAAAWPTTTGTWACPAPAARARRSTTTAAPSTAVTAARRRTRTATWRSGTWSSCRTCCGKVRAKDDFDIEGPAAAQERRHRHGPGADGVHPAGVDNLYEIDTTWKILDRAAELTEQDYGPTAAPTWRCGWSPTTCAAR
jgi:alanyl-tRNA synthetase